MVSADHMDLQSILKQDSSCQFASQERLALDFWRESTHKHYKRGLRLTLYFLPARGHQFLLNMLIIKCKNTIKGLFSTHIFLLRIYSIRYVIHT
jgi:hypothetical protein